MNEHQDFERAWWGDCANTFGEEAKQITYAHRMGLVNQPEIHDWEKWPAYDLTGKSVLDIGGGPASMLLKARGFTRGVVVDPCEYPFWTLLRYAAHGIVVVREPAEVVDFGDEIFDEVWIYNVLQHVENPMAVLERAIRFGRLIRILDFPYTEPHIGHPHKLIPEEMDAKLGGKGTVELVEQENGVHGYCYYGVFRGCQR